MVGRRDIQAETSHSPVAVGYGGTHSWRLALEVDHLNHVLSVDF